MCSTGPGLALALCALLVSSVVAPAALAVQAPGAVAEPAAGSPHLHVFDEAWRAMRETYVDEARTDAGWDALHAEFRPRAAAARSDSEVRAVLRDLLARIDRSHFDLIPADVHARLASAARATGDIGDVGLDVTPVGSALIVRQLQPDGPAARAGIRPGWRMEAIDGLDVASLGGHGRGVRDEGFRLWAVATAMLRGTTGSRLELRLRDAAGESRSVVLERAAVHGIPVTFGHLPVQFAHLAHEMRDLPGGGRAAYVRFNVWMVPLGVAIDEAVHAGRAADGIIFDLRNNPGGVLTMLMGVSGHFLSSPVSLGTVKMRDSELSIVANPRLVGPDGSRVTPYDGKLAVLVDQTSYSASEIFAAGMQAIGRARVFGSQTPGGALPAMLRRLPNGDVLEYAMGDFVTASGERIEGRGVVPDEIVPLTAEALSSGRDPVVDAALAWIGGGEARAQ
jgi:carboxyl-terminal processing protease